MHKKKKKILSNVKLEFEVVAFDLITENGVIA